MLLDARRPSATAVPAGCAGVRRDLAQVALRPARLSGLRARPGLAGPADPAADAVGRRQRGILPLALHRQAHVAGRVGLARAVQEWTPDLLPVVQGGCLRPHLAQRLPGWEVVEPLDAPTGITTLRGGVPFAARAALLERGFVTSAIRPAGPPSSTGRSAG